MVEKSLNLKSPETYRLAHRLAELTGESMTQAVTTALKEQINRVEQQRKKGSLAEEILAIGADCASRLSPRLKKLDVDKFLYDENGLPR